MGRAADRISGVLMIPASDVESELLKNPGAEDVALIVIRAKMTKSWRAR